MGENINTVDTNEGSDFPYLVFTIPGRKAASRYLLSDYYESDTGNVAGRVDKTICADSGNGCYITDSNNAGIQKAEWKERIRGLCILFEKAE